MNFKAKTSVIYRLVLDIDGVICHEFSDYFNAINYDSQKIHEISPGSEIIFLKSQRIENIYYCDHNFDKLVLAIMSWPGWVVDIFSAGSKLRNEELISAYFTQKFSHYSANSNDEYQNLRNLAKLQIFSYDDTIVGKKDLPKGGLEQYGRRKKDLSLISTNIDNVIIADDDRSFILSDQYPYIGISENAFEKIKDKIRYGYDDAILNSRDNAAYIMGIIIECKEITERGEVSSLRAALSKVISHNGRSAIAENDRDYSPWFLHPINEISGYLKNHKNNITGSEFYTKMTKWIEVGESYFKQFEDTNFTIDPSGENLGAL